MVEKDILIRIIETNEGKGNLGTVIRDAAKEAQLPKKEKNPDDVWMIDALTWIARKCENGTEIVNVESSNWYFVFHNFHKEIRRRFPLEIKSVGGYVWSERAGIDQWLIDIREVGKYVSVSEVGKGSTDDYYPNLIFRYTLVSGE